MRGGEHVEPRRDADERVGPRRGAGRQHGRGIRQGTSRTIGPATFCHEAQLVAQAEGITSFSNAPVAGNHSLADLRVGQAHTIVDMGADEFTLGRPHPMIDPTLRDERVLQDAADAGTAVLLLDVVLGYGSADDPLAGLIPALDRARDAARAKGRHLVVVAHVCGTDADPQRRVGVVSRLEEAGCSWRPPTPRRQRGRPISSTARTPPPTHLLSTMLSTTPTRAEGPR